MKVLKRLIFLILEILAVLLLGYFIFTGFKV